MTTDGSSDPTQPTILGWRERVALPEWGIKRIRAKADTGARTCAIDVTDIEELDEGRRVRFSVMLNRRNQRRRSVTVETDVVRRSRVRASLGHAHDRLFVSTTLRIGDRDIETELGLVCRQRMLCRMLLGRSFLREGFLVDSATRYQVGLPRTPGD
ncbi:MAG: ATP-dependent zinc protease [Planctomycetes bacterium]|nr:ATP-dependent zinc protease [Planctomycetota bacterium]